MYELERMRRVVVTIDAWLPAGSPVLLVHVSLHNPSPKPTPVYWWTNMAVPQGPDVRVVAPAERAFHFDYAEQLRLIDFPETAGGDQSYPARFARAADFFMDVPDGERRWITALDGDGRGLVQASTDRLVGRKLFQWGTGAGGQRWQEWLSGPGAAYIELQAGLARTQLEHLALPGGETWEWAEAFGLLEVDPERVHGSWDSARAAVDEGVEMLVPRAELEDALSVAGRFAGPADLLARGSGWARSRSRPAPCRRTHCVRSERAARTRSPGSSCCSTAGCRSATHPQLRSLVRTGESCWRPRPTTGTRGITSACSCWPTTTAPERAKS
jgi:hypothetical protein